MGVAYNRLWKLLIDKKMSASDISSPTYWQKIQEETKGTGNMLCSIKMFEESERLHPVQEEETIKVEKIRGHIVFIGTEDDTLWNAAKYIRRMDERLKTHAHSCTYDVCVRPYGTHFCFPESMLKMMLPFGKKFALGCFFRSAKLHARECEQTRKDIDSVVERALSMW